MLPAWSQAPLLDALDNLQGGARLIHLHVKCESCRLDPRKEKELETIRVVT
jgi:hypothetical protein